MKTNTTTYADKLAAEYARLSDIQDNKASDKALDAIYDRVERDPDGWVSEYEYHLFLERISDNDTIIQ